MVNVLPHALPTLPDGNMLRLDISSVLVTLVSPRLMENVFVPVIGGITLPNVLKFVLLMVLPLLMPSLNSILVHVKKVSLLLPLTLVSVMDI